MTPSGPHGRRDFGRFILSANQLRGTVGWTKAGSSGTLGPFIQPACELSFATGHPHDLWGSIVVRNMNSLDGAKIDSDSHHTTIKTVTCFFAPTVLQYGTFLVARGKL